VITVGSAIAGTASLARPRVVTLPGACQADAIDVATPQVGLAFTGADIAAVCHRLRSRDPPCPPSFDQGDMVLTLPVPTF